MTFLQILILGLVQGAAELLPVSSSAHVIIAEKLMGLDPSSPDMTFLLVMLHTGTMFAVIVYFWNSWLDHYFSDALHLDRAVKNIAVATIITVIVALVLQWIIEKIFLHGHAKAEIESLFSQLPLIGGALLAAGLLILYSGSSEEKQPGSSGINVMGALVIGAVQGLCLPFRGFSRSGGTISAGLLLGIERRQIEEFSFALAVVLTPIVVAKELWRLVKAHPEMTHGPALVKLLTPGLLGMVCSFAAGYLALKLLSRLLEAGRWKYFGYYCLIAAGAVFSLAYAENKNTDSSFSGTNTVPTPVIDATPSTHIDALPSAPATPTDQPVSPASSTTNADLPPPRALPVNPADLTNADSAPASPLHGADAGSPNRGISLIITETTGPGTHTFTTNIVSDEGVATPNVPAAAPSAKPATNSAPANVPAH